MPLGRFIPRPRMPRTLATPFLRRKIWRRQYTDERHEERRRQGLYRRLINAWYTTPTKWYPLPLGVGALLLVGLQWRKRRNEDKKEVTLDHGEEVVRLKGPWQVHVLGALPLRSASRLWGYLNSLQLPVWFRPYSFKLYAYIFGCNLDEVEESDLTKYASLGDFFYRRLKPGVRPIAQAALVSPADGTVLHFGTIHDHRRIEQVKGMTYSLDALLGLPSNRSKEAFEVQFANRDHAIVEDTEFANVNGIQYSVDQLLGSGNDPPAGAEVEEDFDESSSGSSGTSTPHAGQANSPVGRTQDASVEEAASVPQSVAVALEIGANAPGRPSLPRRSSGSAVDKVKTGNGLFFAVVYLAPGDYHRFHSPTAWVVEKRRHFAGELYSVAPYVAKRLHNLFVLNERVALLGRWRYGFFSMIPVGATNVGSIVIDFDKQLRTNLRRGSPPPRHYSEAVYKHASPLLGGQPLPAGGEMGGFKLGSTIVLVFEAPERFQFKVKAGEHVKVGQAFGDVV